METLGARVLAQEWFWISVVRESKALKQGQGPLARSDCPVARQRRNTTNRPSHLLTVEITPSAVLSVGAGQDHVKSLGCDMLFHMLFITRECIYVWSLTEPLLLKMRAGWCKAMNIFPCRLPALCSLGCSERKRCGCDIIIIQLSNLANQK